MSANINITLTKSEIFTWYNQARVSGLDIPRTNRALGYLLDGNWKRQTKYYKTTITSCNCPDAKHRAIVCKHRIVAMIVNKIMGTRTPKIKLTAQQLYTMAMEKQESWGMIPNVDSEDSILWTSPNGKTTINLHIPDNSNYIIMSISNCSYTVRVFRYHKNYGSYPWQLKEDKAGTIKNISDWMIKVRRVVKRR